MFCIRFELLGWKMHVFSQGSKDDLRTYFTLLNDFLWVVIMKMLYRGHT